MRSREQDDAGGFVSNVPRDGRCLELSFEDEKRVGTNLVLRFWSSKVEIVLYSVRGTEYNASYTPLFPLPRPGMIPASHYPHRKQPKALGLAANPPRSGRRGRHEWPGGEGAGC